MKNVRYRIDERNGIQWCFLRKEDYDLLQSHKIQLQLQSQETLSDNYITVEATRCITGDDRSPYFGEAEVALDYNSPQDPIQFVETITDTNPLLRREQ